MHIISKWIVQVNPKLQGIRREVSIHPRNIYSETKISFQVLINITPINDGGIINDSGIIIKYRKENELVIEVPSCSR